MAEPAKEKPKGGLALILGGGSDDTEESGDMSSGESAFRAFKDAMESGDATKGLKAFRELLDAADTEDEPEESADMADDTADDLDL